MIPDAYRRALGGAHGGGVFYLHGEDGFRKEEAAREIAEAHLDPATRDFNFDVIRGSDIDVPQLASVLATPPLMAQWRVVAIRQAEALASLPKARKLVLDLADSTPSGLALILTATKPPQSKAAFYADLQRKARSMEFRPVPPNDLPIFLMSWSRDRHGVEMEEDAARALGAAVGTELGVLAQEVRKLATMVPEGHAITLATVEAGGTKLPKEDRWRWFDSIGERKLRQATDGLAQLFSQGESGVYLVMGLTTHLLRLGVVCESGRGALESNLPPNLRWTAKRFEAQSRHWTGEELERALLGLRRVDQLMKASTLTHHHLLEEWLLRERTLHGEEVA